MKHTLNNRWRHGPIRFELPPLSHTFGRFEGIIPLQATLDSQIGSEVALYFVDRTPFIHKLSALKPFQLRLKMGALNTKHGPLVFFIFWVPDPGRPQAPFVSVDVHLNPFDKKQIALWRDLARQSHWYLFLVDADDQQAGFYEFPNSFGLAETLDQVEATWQSLPRGDFMQAKAEFSARYTPEDLFRLS